MSGWKAPWSASTPSGESGAGWRAVQALGLTAENVAAAVKRVLVA